jgi:hypothetical protein
MKKKELFINEDFVPLNYHVMKKSSKADLGLAHTKFIETPKYNTRKFCSRESYRPISKLF